MFKPYVPNERIVDRAVEIWKRMLRSPKYDNLGDTGTPEERFTSGFAGAVASMIGKPATEEQLAVFGQKLKERLMTEVVREKYRYYEDGLHVDYHPDQVLADCAKEAGITCEFPWKTTSHLYADRFSVGYGYGAEFVYHYPLSGGRWLMTTLSGGDIDKIIAAVEGGNNLGLKVEEQA